MALEKLGPYKFESVLGRGGMGTVYTGRHEKSDELHAVKVLAPTYAHDEHFRGRFESEIKALLKLDHPNIVRLISFGQEDGNLFFSMELVEGNSLFDMQRKGYQFDWKEILRIAKDVAHGLRHAHDRGIIHRDLKPGNLLRTAGGTVKLTDFGIAKAFGSNQNTGENVLGTMDFMSPEQAKGEPVTVRSDLYSLGTVLFTLLSGKPPFTANSIEESLRNLTHVPAPNIGTVVPNVPRELDKLIARLMEKKPEKRIATAQSLLHKIEEVEQTLKNYSEAKTAHHPGSSSNETFELAADKKKSSPTDGFTFADNTDATKQISTSRQEQAKKRDRSSTVEITDHSAGASGTSAKKLDYFNEVSDRQREAARQIEDDAQYGRGVWPLVAGLVAVIAMAGIGTYYATKKPSADALYETIYNAQTEPHKVLDEMQQFLEWYPDDQRQSQVANLKSVGDSIKYYNQLTNRLVVRSKIAGENRLTKLERQFVDIAELAKTDGAAAHAKMNAFVTVHESVPDLSQRDLECVAAAKAYRYQIRSNARESAVADLNNIRAAMKTAAEDPTKAASVYRSIIELYSDHDDERSEESVRELVAEARTLLEQIDKPNAASNAVETGGSDQ